MADSTFDTDEIVVIRLPDFNAGGSTIINKFQRVFFGANSGWAAERGDISEEDKISGYPTSNLSNITNIGKLSVPVRMTGNNGSGVLDANLSVGANSDDVILSTGGLITDVAGFTADDVGAFLYNGADPNNLIVIGKIKTFVDSSQVTIEKANTTGYTAVPAYILRDTDNFSYPNNGSFIVLIRPKLDTPLNYYVPSIAQLQTITSGLPDMNPTYFNLKKISKVRDAGNTASATSVRSSILRLSGFTGEVPVNGNANVLWKAPTTGNDDNDGDPNTVLFANEDMPYWVAYLVSPFRGQAKDLEKGTSYVLSVEETQPTPDLAGTPTLITIGNQINNTLSFNSLI